MGNVEADAQAILHYLSARYTAATQPSSDFQLQQVEINLRLTIPPILNSLYKSTASITGANGLLPLAPLTGENSLLHRTRRLWDMQDYLDFDASNWICFGWNGNETTWIMNARGDFELAELLVRSRIATPLGRDLLAFYHRIQTENDTLQQLLRDHPDLIQETPSQLAFKRGDMDEVLRLLRESKPET